jgi:hypothetical protein
MYVDPGVLAPYIMPGSYKSYPRCYYDVGKLAPADIIPCYAPGVPSTEPVACCKKGNKCMEQGTCYDGDSTVTYQYGCTDSSYEHENCPWKCNLDRCTSSVCGFEILTDEL